MPKNKNSPDIDKINHLGEVLFSGAILFISVSFGLFTFAVDKGADTLNITWFSISLGFALLAGIFSLISSFMGIKSGNMKWIVASFISLIVMIVILGIDYIQIFSNIIDEAPTLNPGAGNIVP